ncbi:unnamed protein product [Colias eurytheme]|nr:unnamed protein product [Colias eurytheme]
MTNRYYFERTKAWMLNNKIIVFLSLLSFCLFVSTLAMAGQRNRLNNELSDLRNSITTVKPAPDENDNGAGGGDNGGDGGTDTGNGDNAGGGGTDTGNGDNAGGDGTDTGNGDNAGGDGTDTGNGDNAGGDGTDTGNGDNAGGGGTDTGNGDNAGGGGTGNGDNGSDAGADGGNNNNGADNGNSGGEPNANNNVENKNGNTSNEDGEQKETVDSPVANFNAAIAEELNNEDDEISAVGASNRDYENDLSAQSRMTDSFEENFRGFDSVLLEKLGIGS